MESLQLIAGKKFRNMPKKYSAAAAIYVKRDTLSFYAPEFTEILSMPLTAEVTQDLSIVNQQALQRIVLNWLKQTQYQPLTVIIFFSEETYFFQDYTTIPESLEDETVTAFLSTVPHTNIVTKIFPTSSGARVIAVNRDLLQPIISVLEKVGFSVLAASPSFAAGFSQEAPFSVELAAPALDNETVFTAYNFLELEDLERKVEGNKDFFSVKFDKKLIAMVVVFVLLIIVLVALLLYQGII